MDLNQAVAIARDAADHAGEANIATATARDNVGDLTGSVTFGVTFAQHCVEQLSALAQFASGTGHEARVTELLGAVSNAKDQLSQAVSYAATLHEMTNEAQAALATAETDLDELAESLNS